MTYLELAFDKEEEARRAVAELTALDVGGEWYLRPAEKGWRLSVTAEGELRPAQVQRLGGRPVGVQEGEAPSSPEEPPSSTPTPAPSPGRRRSRRSPGSGPA